MKPAKLKRERNRQIRKAICAVLGQTAPRTDEDGDWLPWDALFDRVETHLGTFLRKHELPPAGRELISLEIIALCGKGVIERKGEADTRNYRIA